MATKQRLTLASMWAFEAVGVNEIEEEVKNTIPQVDSLEYFKTDDVLVAKGNIEDSVPKVASAFADFVEEQKDKDLLDMPRVRQLDVPAVLSDEGMPAISSPEKHQGPSLLALDDDSDENIVPYLRNHATKFWKSPNGGLGCFSNNFHDVLAGVATATGTEIAIVDETQGIRVSGTSEDVEDALTKLIQIEKPLSFLLGPNVTNVMIVPHKDNSSFCIQNYSSVNPDASRRVLEVPKMCSTIDVGRMCVTVSLSFDNDSQVWTIPGNRLNPPPISEEPGSSRIWNGFTFQEVGKADEFADIVPIIENNPANPQILVSGIAPPHPFLTADKAKQVNQWVVERAEMQPTEQGPEPEPVLELESDFEPQPELERRDVTLPKPKRETANAPQSRRPPGMKTRKAATTTKAVAPSEQPQANQAKPVAIDLTETAATPRKRWTMVYRSGADDATPDDSDALNSESSNLNDTLDLPGDLLLFAKPQTAENRVRLPNNFDAGKYGLNQSLRQTPKEKEHSPSFKRIMPVKSKRNPSNPNELIDVFEPANTAVVGAPSRIPFNQPPLIPDSSLHAYTSNTRNTCSQEISDANSNNIKLGSPICGMDVHSIPSGSGSTGSIFGCAALGDENLPEQENRLSFLKEFLEEQTSKVPYPDDHGQIRSFRYEFNKLLVKESLAKLETVHRDQDRQGPDETSTREFYRTMGHKTANPTNKAKSKSEIKAKRQATLEDAWGFFKKPVKKLSADAQPFAPKAKGTWKSEIGTLTIAGSTKIKLDTESAEKGTTPDIENLFEALKPTLEAAEYFPGSLNLEVQLGLILIPLLPKTCTEGSIISLNEWTKIFQSQTGIPSPTTKFISRLTTSGIDVDYLVDLKTSAPEGKRRIFEQDYSDFSVFYEFHCRTRTGHMLVISVDEQGKSDIKKHTAALGAVNLHFPRQVWDARVVLCGTPNYGSVGREFEEAAKYLIEHLWVQPNTSLVQIFTRLPPGDKITIEKVYMKRWTRHRFIHPSRSIITAKVASHIRSNSAMRAETDLKGDATGKSQVSVENGAEAENQDIFLQAMEVQDLCIGSSPSDDRAVTACCASLSDMTENGRQWYEVSLVSSAIEAILRANVNVEIGERTDEWRSSDLLGRDATLLEQNAGESYGPTSPVAKAVGFAGLGDLLRLTKTVVEKMDGVGFWNHGLDHDTVQAFSVSGSVGTLDQTIRLEPRSLEFDDLESIREFGSVMVTTMTKKSSAASSEQEKEQLELSYW